jgi:hypothetical protein
VVEGSTAAARAADIEEVGPAEEVGKTVGPSEVVMIQCVVAIVVSSRYFQPSVLAVHSCSAHALYS